MQLFRPVFLLRELTVSLPKLGRLQEAEVTACAPLRRLCDRTASEPSGHRIQAYAEEAYAMMKQLPTKELTRGAAARRTGARPSR